MKLTIQGESGKSFGPARRTLAEAQVGNPTVSEISLGVDTLTWSMSVLRADLSGAVVPQVGELITLWGDDTVKFRGWAKRPVVTGEGSSVGVAVTVVGPGWWLEQEKLSQTQTDALGMAAGRTSYVFPEGRLDDSIRALFVQAAAVGLPVQCGALPVMMTWPQITLADMTYAAALTELMRPQTDCVAWWDYSVFPPAFRVSKRDTAAAKTFTVGQDISGFQIAQQDELMVTDVDCVYVDRLPDGRAAFNTLSTRAKSASLVVGSGNSAFRLTARVHGATGNQISASVTSGVLSLATPQGTITVLGCTTAQAAVDAINASKASNAVADIGPCRLTATKTGQAGNGLTVIWSLGTVAAGNLGVTVDSSANSLSVKTLSYSAKDFMAMVNGHPLSRIWITAELRSGYSLTSTGSASTVVLTNANDGAAAWVAADLPSGSDGSGAVANAASAFLSGGQDYVIGTPGQRQILTVSGPELDSFLPLAQTDICQIQTLALGSVSYSDVVSGDQTWGNFYASYPTVSLTVGPTTAVWDSAPTGADSSYATRYNVTAGVATTISDEYGNPVVFSVWDRLIVGSVPDWLTKDLGIYSRSATIKGSISALYGTAYDGGTTTPAWANAFAAICGSVQIGITWVAGGGGVWHLAQWALGAAPFSFPITIVNTQARSLSTIFRKADYGYFRPPATLATDLAAAQSFPPIHGFLQTVPTTSPDLGWTGRVFNLAGGLPEHAIMRALAQSASTNLYTGATRIELGAPQRLSFSALASRLRRTAQDNIRYLR